MDIMLSRTASAADLSDANSFIKGVDISTLQALEDAGVKYYDSGVDKDLLAILKDRGVNYVRLRVWNDPVEANGYNDKEKLIELAPRVKEAGMKLLVDFHYSDFWADPGKQVKPAAWASLDFAGLKQAVYDYTAEVLTDLEAVGVYPDMVQIGNEINNGMIHPDGALSKFANLAALIKQGVQAVRDTTPQGHDVKIMLHLAEGGDNAKFRSFFDQVAANAIDYDIIGMSYYPYWHGTFQQLKSNMNDMAARYGKQIVVAETAFPYTLENGDDLDNIAGLSETTIAGFPASVENQKLVMETVLNTAAHVDGGLGLGAFYWEPAWLPGVGWKAGEGNGWDNQAMFDFDGNALESLDAFLYTPGSLGASKPIMIYPAQAVTTPKGTEPVLPAKVDVLYNDGSIQATDATWDAVDPALWNAAGKFTVNGTVSGVSRQATVEINVTDKPNLLQNPGFEDGLTGWTIAGASGAAKIEKNAGNAHSGAQALNYWQGSPYSFKVSQTVTGLKDGIYTLKAWSSGGGGESKLRLVAENYGGTELGTDTVNTGYNDWHSYTVENIHVTSGQLTVGFDVEAPGEVWGYFDDFELVLESEDKTVRNGDFEQGDLSHWTLSGTTAAGKIESKISDVYEGSYAFNYWYGSPYTFKLTQTITGVRDGIYTLKAWASGGGGETKLKLIAENYGGDALGTNIANTGYNVWKPYTVENIRVTNGQITIGFDVEAPGEVWGFFDQVELIKVEEPVSRLIGPSEVGPNETFTLEYGIGNLADAFLTQELTVRYDPAHLELVNAQSLVDGVHIVTQTENEEKSAVYLVLSATGVPISNAQALLGFQFRAKNLAQLTETAVTVANASVSDGVKTVAVAGTTASVQIHVQADKSALTAAIGLAEAKLNATKAGTFLGGYPAASRNALQAAIANAKTVAANPSANQSQVNGQVADLEEAVQAYLDSAHTLATMPGPVSIQDLAIVAKGYGKTTADANWYLYKPLDANADGRIDIVDLAAAAKKIPSKF